MSALRVWPLAEVNAVSLEEVLVPAAGDEQVPAGVLLYVRNHGHRQRAVTLHTEAGNSHTVSVKRAKRRRRWARSVPTDMIMGPLPAATISYPAGPGGLLVAAVAFP